MDVWLTLIFAKSETTWDIITKISAFLQLLKKWILWEFGGCSSKIEPATPIWSFRCFWREIQIIVPRSFKFGTKWVPIEVNNWWKFGVDISNHFWEIQILRFFVFQVSPTTYKNNFWKLFQFPFDELLELLNECDGIKAIGFADDLVILINGIDEQKVYPAYLILMASDFSQYKSPFFACLLFCYQSGQLFL